MISIIAIIVFIASGFYSFALWKYTVKTIKFFKEKQQKKENSILELPEPDYRTNANKFSSLENLTPAVPLQITVEEDRQICVDKPQCKAWRQSKCRDGRCTYHCKLFCKCI